MTILKNMPGISIICLPLKCNDIFTGLIYLESRENNRFNSLTVEDIKRYSFYLVARQALERETVSSKVFIKDTVKDRLTEREMEVLCCICCWDDQQGNWSKTPHLCQYSQDPYHEPVREAGGQQ
jgi:hypothetical protein